MNNKTSSDVVKRRITRGSEKKRRGGFENEDEDSKICSDKVGGEEHEIFGGNELTFGRCWFK